MADTYTLTANTDGSASLVVVFDVTGMGFNPTLTQNDTPYSLPPQLDGNGNIVPWTQDAAVAALATQIAASKAAFFAAAANYVPPQSD
jgi:hypothetical protein